MLGKFRVQKYFCRLRLVLPMAKTRELAAAAPIASLNKITLLAPLYKKTLLAPLYKKTPAVASWSPITWMETWTCSRS